MTTLTGTQSVATSLYGITLITTNGRKVLVVALGLPRLTGPVSVLNESVVSTIFPDFDVKKLQRPSSPVDLLLGGDYFGLHPKQELASDGKNLSVMQGYLGVCLQGSHPLLKEATEKDGQVGYAVKVVGSYHEFSRLWHKEFNPVIPVCLQVNMFQDTDLKLDQLKYDDFSSSHLSGDASQHDASQKSQNDACQQSAHDASQQSQNDASQQSEHYASQQSQNDASQHDAYQKSEHDASQQSEHERRRRRTRLRTAGLPTGRSSSRLSITVSRPSSRKPTWQLSACAPSTRTITTCSYTIINNYTQSLYLCGYHLYIIIIIIV